MSDGVLITLIICLTVGAVVFMNKGGDGNE